MFNKTTQEQSHSEQQHPERKAHRKVHKGVGADERKEPQDKNDTELRESGRRHAEAKRRGGEVVIAMRGEREITELTDM